MFVALSKMLHAKILIIAFVTVKGEECVKRSFGDTGSVCVCNSTYCDTIEVPPIQEDQFFWYKSSKDGKMMEFSFNNFSTKNEFSQESKEKCDKVVLTLDSNKKYQQICGFGGAMTDSAALNIKTLSNLTQHNLLESYYGVTGIGYTFARIPIAGTDFSTRGYTYDDIPGDITLSNFSLVEEDDYKIQHLQHIKRIMPNSNDLRIFTTSWSAPSWMKNTNNIEWGYLENKYYQIYANYILQFFDAYKKRGIDIWAISPANEPIDGLIPNFPFNAMAWGPTALASWTVNNLAPTLSKAGYKDLVYMAVDDQRSHILSYSLAMFENKEADKLFSGIAVHWYIDEVYPPSLLDITHKIFPQKFLLITEACTGAYLTEYGSSPVVLGSWERGEGYMTDIIQNLSLWVCGFVDWNIALNDKGGPNWVENYVDSPIIVNPEQDEFYKQPMFYALSHFSKFVPRDSYVISSTQEKCLSQKLIRSIAFLTPEQKIVVVIANMKNESIPLTIKHKMTNKIIDINLSPKSFHTITYLI